MHLLDEIEEHNHVAHDHSNQARNSQKRHEAKGRAHHVKRDQALRNSIWRGGQNQYRLDRMLELKCQREKNHADRNRHHHGQIPESIHLFGLLTAHDNLVAGRQRILQFL